MKYACIILTSQNDNAEKVDHPPPEEVPKSRRTRQIERKVLANDLLKRFIGNIKQKNGEEYKERTLKQYFNTLAVVIQAEIYSHQKRKIDIFKGLRGGEKSSRRREKFEREKERFSKQFQRKIWKVRDHFQLRKQDNQLNSIHLTPLTV